MKGQIFDIKRFSLHDGPGIRTTAFLKGCPLRCIWCHNPEGIRGGNDIWVKGDHCVQCGRCVKICPNGAMRRGGEHAEVDHTRCTFCGLCIVACPARAIERIDERIDSTELVNRLMRDKVFADESGGGVTLSGGEPLSQPEFALEVLEKLKQKGMNTCIETSMYADRSVIERLPALVNHFLLDIKLFDAQAHQRYTGVANNLILDNFRYLAQHAENIVVRIPLIPEITATKENIGAIVGFVKVCSATIPIELLNYNSFAGSKYRFLNEKFYDETARAFTKEQMKMFEKMLDG